MGEFVETVRLLHSRSVGTRFQEIGSPDPDNPVTITEGELVAYRQENEVALPGHRLDNLELFAGANMVTLPSYYGKGLPKAPIEAAASP